MSVSFDDRLGWQGDAFTVAEFKREGQDPTYKGVWNMRPCCERGHKTVKAAADHAARINRDRAVEAWNRSKQEQVHA